MPKVTNEYFVEKQNHILACTSEILKEKPLYLLSMRDIIKKAQFSQGAIYRYYANLDEIIIDLLNKTPPQYPLEQEIDKWIHSGQDEKTVLYECILAIGKYFDSMFHSVGHRIFLEFLVLYAYDAEKREQILPQLKFKQSLEYAITNSLDYALAKIELGIFQPKMPVRSIVLFVSSFIDGIPQSVAYYTGQSTQSFSYISRKFLDNNPEGIKEQEPETMFLTEMFKTLAKILIDLL